MSTLVHTDLPSPLGRLRLLATEHALVGVYLPEQSAPSGTAEREPAGHRILDLAAQQLDAYFRGALRAFALPLAPLGTRFQRRVWNALCAIPFAEQRSYGALATALDLPRAARAIGHANARNPLAIVVPCHRVLGANGALTGYAGGLPAKRFLLEHEQRVAPVTRSARRAW